MSESAGYRLFVALPLPPAVKQTLLALNRDFTELKFANNLHLTLRFIGQSAQTDAYSAALQTVRVKPFALRLVRLGFFRHGILWAGPDNCPQLTALKQAVDSALACAGLAPDSKPYSPHITLCRLKQPPSPRLRKLAESIKLDTSWEVKNFCLYQSVLRPQGAIHTVVTVCPPEQ